LFTLIDPGDELVLFEPFYPYHLSLAKLAGAGGADAADRQGRRRSLRGIEGNLGAENETRRRQHSVEPHRKGVVATRTRKRCRISSPTKTMVVTDEIYEDLCFDGRTHVPPATVPGLFDRTVTISGLSKAYSITGWRLGWIAAPEAITRAIGPVFDIMCVCAPRPFQHAAVEALRTLPESWYGGQRDAYARRRTLLADALRAGGFVPRIPEGAYYMAADYSGVFGDLSPRDACFALLDRFHIGAIPSDLFHADASGATPFLRFQFAVEEPVLREVERRMARGGV
jgi:aminotransferase